MDVCTFQRYRQRQDDTVGNDKEGANGEYNVYKYMEGRLPEGDNLIESTETVNTQENNLKLKLSRSSIRVLVQK